jgi:hypothetical protein
MISQELRDALQQQVRSLKLKEVLEALADICCEECEGEDVSDEDAANMREIGQDIGELSQECYV